MQKMTHVRQHTPIRPEMSGKAWTTPFPKQTRIFNNDATAKVRLTMQLLYDTFDIFLRILLVIRSGPDEEKSSLVIDWHGNCGRKLSEASMFDLKSRLTKGLHMKLAIVASLSCMRSMCISSVLASNFCKTDIHRHMPHCDRSNCKVLNVHMLRQAWTPLQILLDITKTLISLSPSLIDFCERPFWFFAPLSLHRWPWVQSFKAGSPSSPQVIWSMTCNLLFCRTEPVLTAEYGQRKLEQGSAKWRIHKASSSQSGQMMMCAFATSASYWQAYCQER